MYSFLYSWCIEHLRIKWYSSSTSRWQKIHNLCSLGNWVNLPFSIINECALNLYLVINWIYLTAIGFNKYDCRHNLFVKYLYKTHFDDVEKNALQSCWKQSCSLCLKISKNNLLFVTFWEYQTSPNPNENNKCFTLSSQ